MSNHVATKPNKSALYYTCTSCRASLGKWVSAPKVCGFCGSNKYIRGSQR